ncbi:BON domain-containing protein [Shinella zoogloeoides]|uniref:BON domain-containing protein n=1 Tax=Shinella zoogloeoides TaxID=352475 RepID=UPI000E65C4A1
MASDFSSGAAGAGLRASLVSAIAYDEICNSCRIEVTITAQSVILSGTVTPEAAQRALQIVREIAGSAPIWDRMIWL